MPPIVVYFSLLFHLALARHNLVHNSRIYQGHNTYIEKYPYFVHLYDNVENQVYAAGTILTPNCILTAAHVVPLLMEQQHQIVIHAGHANCSSPHLQIRQVAAAYMHNDYVVPHQGNDVAILKLSAPLHLEPAHVERVKLNYGPVHAGAVATVIGQGETELPAENFYVERPLKEVKLKILQQNKCRKRLAYSVFLETMLCAAGEHGEDSCHGDSGGPLLVAGQQVGIVSWGPGSCGIVGVYTKISSPRVSQFIRNTSDKVC